MLGHLPEVHEGLSSITIAIGKKTFKKFLKTTYGSSKIIFPGVSRRRDVSSSQGFQQQEEGSGQWWRALVTTLASLRPTTGRTRTRLGSTRRHPKPPCCTLPALPSVETLPGTPASETFTSESNNSLLSSQSNKSPSLFLLHSAVLFDDIMRAA